MWYSLSSNIALHAVYILVPRSKLFYKYLSCTQHYNYYRNCYCLCCSWYYMFYYYQLQPPLHGYPKHSQIHQDTHHLIQNFLFLNLIQRPHIVVEEHCQLL